MIDIAIVLFVITFLVWQGVPQTLDGRLTQQRSKVESNSSRAAQSPRRSRSRCY